MYTTIPRTLVRQISRSDFKNKLTPIAVERFATYVVALPLALWLACVVIKHYEMLPYEKTLEKICSPGSWTTYSKRKKCMKQLRELYKSEEPTNKLSENSNNESGTANQITWTKIIRSVHKILLLEVDDKSSASKSKPSDYSQTLLMTIEKANSSKILVKCEDLVQLVMQIFSKEAYINYYEIYLTILVNHILSIRQYSASISSNCWRELLDFAIKFYGAAKPCIDRNLILEAVHTLIEHGCRQSHLALYLKETIFLFLVQVFQSIKKSDPKSLSENAFKIANAVCEQIGPESRMTVCKFGEEVMPFAIELDSSPAKYNWMLFIVRAHNPGGVPRNHDAAYAYNSDDWTNILRLIYKRFIVENNYESNNSSYSFVQLACEVLWQLKDDGTCLDDVSNIDVVDYARPPKRKTILINTEGIIDVLTAAPPSEHNEHLIRILIALVTKYPEFIEGNHFQTLMKFIIDHSRSCEQVDLLEPLWELAKVMFELDSKLSRTQADNYTKKWDEIWNIALRSDSINKNKEQVHKFLQSFLQRRKSISCDAILNLYIENAIAWSKPSVRTLLVLCKHNAIQDSVRTSTNENHGRNSNDQKSRKMRLLEWVLTIPINEWNAQFPVEDTCELLFHLTLKSRSNVDQITVSDISRQSSTEKRSYIISDVNQRSESKNLQYDFADMEYIHAITALVDNLYDETVVTNISHSDDVRIENVSYVEENYKLLIERLFHKNGMMKESELHKQYIQIAVVAKIISNLKQLNMSQQDVEERFGSYVKNLSKDTSRFIIGIINSKKKFESNKLVNVLEALHLFYKTSYQSDVASIIQSSTELVMLENILRLTNVGSLQYISDKSEKAGKNSVECINHFSGKCKCFKEDDQVQELNSLSNESNIRIKACTVLGTFCGMVSDVGNISTIQKDLLKTLLNPQKYCLKEICDLKMTTTVLELLVDCKVEVFSDDITKNFLELLQELYLIWYKDSEAARDILNILSKIFVRMESVDSEVHRKGSIGILNSFRKLFKENEPGPMVYTTFIGCLKTIEKVYPHIIWTKWNDGAECGTPIVEDLLTYIQSPFHVVRLRAINCLQTMFTSNNVNVEWLSEVFSKLDGAMNSLVIVEEEVDKTKVEDDRRNRNASALHIMAVVIYSSALFRSRALLSMFQFSVDKSIRFDDVNKVLKRVSASLQIEKSTDLVENYLNYLLTYWLERSNSLDQFPISSIECTSNEQFYERYFSIIVPIILQKKGWDNAKKLCDKYRISFKIAIEKCFPRLISWLLPHVSVDLAKRPWNFTITDIERAMEVLGILDGTATPNELHELENVPVLIESNLVSVILSIIRCLHDKTYSTNILKIPVNYPSSDPPHFECQDIDRSFKYLEDNLMKTEHSLLNLLVTEKQDVLQKVLLDLKHSIHSANFDEYQLKALHHYVYFSMMILEEIERDYFDEMEAFVIRDICYTLIHFVNKSSDFVSHAACGYLLHLLENMPLGRHKEIQKNLRLIVNSMTPIVLSRKNPRAFDVMKLLIVERCEWLEDAIGRLDSFPNDCIFNEMREVHSKLKYKVEQGRSLENEINHFLNTRDGNPEICSIVELNNLSEKLSKEKAELKEMYQRLEFEQRFSEDYAYRSLHRLICALIKLTASSDLDISLTASKCLGELGPADLSTMILQPGKSRTKQLSDPMLIFTYRVLVLLSNLLIHPNVQLFTATSKALYIIMSSFWGQKIYADGRPEELKCEPPQESLQIKYIRPFVAKPSKTSNTLSIDVTKFNKCTIENTEIWTGELNFSHRDWITAITCTILNCFSDSYLKDLIPVCQVNESFCGKILPWIVHLIICADKELESIIYDNVNRFFKFHLNDSNSSEIKITLLTTSDEHKKKRFKSKSVRCMLNVVNFIRSQTPDRRQFEFNYLDIAKAAQICSAHFTSVLYAELWCESLLRNWLRTEGLTPIDYICETEPENGKVMQEILKDACKKIGDPDAIYGCGISYFQNPSAKLEHYAQFNKWDQVLLIHDVESSLGNKIARQGLLNALQHSGLQYSLNACLSKNNEDDQGIDINYQYECAWRLSDWNMPLSHSPMNSLQDSPVRFQDPVTNDYSLFRYETLRSFHEHNDADFKTALKSARLNAIRALRNISLESCKTIYPSLTQLQMLREIEEIYFASPEEYNSVIEKWKNQDSIAVNDFQYIEPILSQRTVFLLDKETIDKNGVRKFLVDTYLRLAELSEEHGYFQVATRALGSLSKQERLPIETSDTLQYQEAVLASTNGNHDLGRRLLRNLIVKKSFKSDIHAQALTTYGNWMAETKSENPQKIIKEYYQASLECSKKIESPTERSSENILNTHAALAQFADVQYQCLVTYMKSRHFKSLGECSVYTDKVAEQLPASSKDDKKRVDKLKKQSSINKIEEKNIKSEKDMYLLLAVKHYIATLREGDDHDLLIFKLVSLWLDNARLKSLSDLLDDPLKNLPSHKFILSVPQLAPHMNESGDAFSRQIDHLLERCAHDHPHHTLPVLLSLMNSYKDDQFKETEITPSIDEPRVLAARKLIEKLKDTELGPIIEETEKLADSLIMLANLKTEKKDVSGQFSVPESQSISRLKNLERILVPILSINVRPDAKYENITGIREYDKVFNLVGGKNAPKKITCVCTDGKRRDQLVKGEDDLRQDAVMQQVFTVMNRLLRTSKIAVKRKLRVRTYKVVPLSKRSGILEWCDNTIPIGEVLEGPNGLHKKYYPKDYETSVCKENLKTASKDSNEVRLEVFMDCCKHLHPVFHYFFFESFPSPEIWFERRLSYMRSIATTSIIGYILGLGDRHLFNMLIDKSTAEVIHIDFGIAFDQGKILSIPEIVPFRLTRDIEAAMGASGIEGVFRRSCEETLTVLRNQKKVIITLLQVLLYDPISSWEIPPTKLLDRPKAGGEEHSPECRQAPGETNQLAERALLQLEQKLQGIEEGSPYSVAGQVEKLIQEARDPVKLSQSYWELQPCL